MDDPWVDDPLWFEWPRGKWHIAVASTVETELELATVTTACDQTLTLPHIGPALPAGFEPRGAACSLCPALYSPSPVPTSNPG